MFEITAGLDKDLSTLNLRPPNIDCPLIQFIDTTILMTCIPHPVDQLGEPVGQLWGCPPLHEKKSSNSTLRVLA